MGISTFAPGQAGTPTSGTGTGADLYPEHLPGRFTGGFGEPTCHSCHFDYELNRPEGSLVIEGLDENYVPGKIYRIKVTLYRDGLERAGLQLTFRTMRKSQAGSLHWSSGRLAETPLIDSPVTYLQHSEAGVEPTEDGTAEWEFEWLAPDSKSGKVMVHLAANAANGDASEFGDWVYTREIPLTPAE